MYNPLKYANPPRGHFKSESSLHPCLGVLFYSRVVHSLVISRAADLKVFYYHLVNEFFDSGLV